jgi:hypothetical protein
MKIPRKIETKFQADILFNFPKQRKLYVGNYYLQKSNGNKICS